MQQKCGKICHLKFQMDIFRFHYTVFCKKCIKICFFLYVKFKNPSFSLLCIFTLNFLLLMYKKKIFLVIFDQGKN